MVQQGFEDAIRAHPDLTSVVSFDRKGLGRSLRHGNLKPLYVLARQLQAKRYDLVLDCQGLFRSGFLSWLTRSPLRVGPADAREFGWMFYTKRVAPPDMNSTSTRHTVAAMLDIADAVGASKPSNLPDDQFVGTEEMRLYTPPDAIESIKADARFDRSYILMAPGSRWPGKQWPADRFASLISRLLTHMPDHAIVLTGAPNEHDLCESIAQSANDLDHRIINMAGRTSIGQLMALIQSSRLVVANDSATVHMAVGLDRPLVALYGPTDIARVGPCNRQADVISHLTPGMKAHHKNTTSGQRLMACITVDEVFQACLQRLDALPVNTPETTDPIQPEPVVRVLPNKPAPPTRTSTDVPRDG